MGPLKTLNLSNAANGLINSGRNTKESLLMTFGIKRVIAAEFGVDYHERSVGRLLKQLGFSHLDTSGK